MRVEDIPTLLSRLVAGQGPPVLSFYRGRTLVGQLTPEELRRRVEQGAATLQRHGVGAGDRVAVLAPNGLDVPVWLLAIWRVGAVAVPLNPNASSGDWQHILQHAGVRGLVGARELIGAVSSPALELVRSFDAGFGPTPTAPLPTPVGFADAAAIILYTSGTTGLPKGVTLSQRNLLANAFGMARNFRLGGATQLAVLPLYHAHALGFGLMTALTTGGHLVFTERFDPLSWAELVRAHAVDYASVTPNLLPLLLQTRLRRADVPSLRALLVSSAPLGADTARRFEAETGVPLVHGWGLSEYTNFACCTSPFADDADRRELFFGDEVPSVGSPLWGTEMSVRDEAGEPRGEGERGELCVRGPCRMLSYFRDPGATGQALYGDWLRTGDQGFFRLQNGQPCFYVTGRLKEIIIRGGEKYSPVAVENRLLAELPELAGRLAVVGFPHTLQGEEIGAYVEADPVSEGFETRLVAAVERLPADVRPKVILHGPAPIPRTHTGKVQRRHLLPLFAGFGEHRGRTQLVRVSSP
jgi:long-chain acyl-CoA synthetase